MYLERKEKLINLREELQNIISTGEAEKRELAENENTRLAEIRAEIDTLEAEIKEEENRNKEIKNNSIPKLFAMKILEKDKIIEEYADGIHFITSISIMHSISPIFEVCHEVRKLDNEQLSCMFKELFDLISTLNNPNDIRT